MDPVFRTGSPPRLIARTLLGRDPGSPSVGSPLAPATGFAIIAGWGEMFTGNFRSATAHLAAPSLGW